MNDKLLSQHPSERRNRYKAFLLSLISPGAGELYCGKPAEGLFLMVLRPLVPAFLLFLWMVQPESLLWGLPGGTLLFLIITIASPARAALLASRQRKVTVTRWYLYGGHILFSLTISLFFIAALSSIISLVKITDSDNAPSLLPGDIALVQLYNNTKPAPGDLLLLQSGKFSRYIAPSSDRVTLHNGRLTLDHYMLPVEPLEDAVVQFRFQNFTSQVILERREKRGYPVLLPEGETATVVLNHKKNIICPDNRVKKTECKGLRNNEIFGKVEGVLLSTRIYRWFMPAAYSF